MTWSACCCPLCTLRSLTTLALNGCAATLATATTYMCCHFQTPIPCTLTQPSTLLDQDWSLLTQSAHVTSWTCFWRQDGRSVIVIVNRVKSKLGCKQDVWGRRFIETAWKSIDVELIVRQERAAWQIGSVGMNPNRKCEYLSWPSYVYTSLYTDQNWVHSSTLLMWNLRGYMVALCCICIDICIAQSTIKLLPFIANVWAFK